MFNCKILTPVEVVLDILEDAFYETINNIKVETLNENVDFNKLKVTDDFEF